MSEKPFHWGRSTDGSGGLTLYSGDDVVAVLSAHEALILLRDLAAAVEEQQRRTRAPK